MSEYVVVPAPPPLVVLRKMLYPPTPATVFQDRLPDCRVNAPEQPQRHSDHVAAGSSSMMRIVDDLLDFSRIEQGRLRLQLQTADIVTVVERAAQAFVMQPGGE